jgi:hypothetical protein
MIFVVYDMCKDGQTREAIAARLGIPLEVYKRWLTKNPAISLASKCGKVHKGDRVEQATAFDEFILGKLPEDLKPFWLDCRMAQKRGKEVPIGVQKLETEQRQMLFLTAWMKFRFNATKALRFTGIKRDTLNNWMTSPRFQKLMHELSEAKKDFFEDALIGSVVRGETAAIVFANKTLNRDRGYGEKREVEVSGAIQHNHSQQMIDLSDLNLPIEIQAAIADAMEKRRKFLADKNDRDAIDVEYKAIDYNQGKFEAE